MPTDVGGIVTVTVSSTASSVGSGRYGRIAIFHGEDEPIVNTADITARMRSYDSLTAMVTAGYTATDAVYLAAAAVFTKSNQPVWVVRWDTTGTTEDAGDALAEARAISDDWKGLALTSAVIDASGTNVANTDVQAIQTWAAANDKALILGTADTGALITGDVTSLDGLITGANALTVYSVSNADAVAGQVAGELASYGLAAARKPFEPQPACSSVAYQRQRQAHSTSAATCTELARKNSNVYRDQGQHPHL